MFTRKIFNQLASALKAEGYTVEPFNPKHTDVIDIWHKKRSLGFIEVTACHVDDKSIVLCPVDYDNPDQSLIEILSYRGFDGELIGWRVDELVRQLDEFYSKSKRA